ncbi:chromosome partitioning protein ParA [Candidatus Falkowbacteria bacterium HGW-Falkowbacteria-1]|jgi:chromosome partitioning protein|uniref:Chromosome partitioning protein ParA n=1 Tax=Candidatus Falkowbacteria bacterium HGW-Falkowbacteria-1 TaxID=2013768 RepID=A0A2N2E9X0_9BACT|nr:MAG: chromosome partitioning protein ParA [Candidatus Falkowbacteria bacterium HGW-Falkowbacteria-1]
MGKIISIVNQKGGVGKTTTSVNIGAYLAYFGKKVLLVDLDPQANASSGLGVNHRQVEKGIYDVLIGECSLFDAVIKTKQENYYIIPATIALSGASVELVNLDNREFRLSSALEGVKDRFDYIIIDGPPSLGLLTVNSLTASDQVIIPIQSEYYALEGLGQLLETISLIQNNLKPSLGIMGVAITMFDKRNRLSSLVKDELYKYFPNKVFKSIIPRSVRLAEAPSYGQSILQYDPKSVGARAYEGLAKEIIELN